MHGIKASLSTGIIFVEIIPIGSDTEMVTVMTRNFIINTIVTRAEVGIKDSMAVLPLMDGARIKVAVPTMMDETRLWLWLSTGWTTPRQYGEIVPVRKT